jgi:hypothetical protein
MVPSSSKVQEKLEKSPPENENSFRFLQTAAANMSDSMNFMKNPALKVMLAIDEARKLIKHKALDENNVEISYFHIFCRVLSQVPSDHHGFSTVFTNTTLSLLANVTPWLVDERS